jgi:hypothetical protein
MNYCIDEKEYESLRENTKSLYKLRYKYIHKYGGSSVKVWSSEKPSNNEKYDIIYILTDINMDPRIKVSDWNSTTIS